MLHYFNICYIHLLTFIDPEGSLQPTGHRVPVELPKVSRKWILSLFFFFDCLQVIEDFTIINSYFHFNFIFVSAIYRYKYLTKITIINFTSVKIYIHIHTRVYISLFLSWEVCATKEWRESFDFEINNRTTKGSLKTLTFKLWSVFESIL